MDDVPFIRLLRDGRVYGTNSINIQDDYDYWFPTEKPVLPWNWLSVSGGTATYAKFPDKSNLEPIECGSKRKLLWRCLGDDEIVQSSDYFTYWFDDMCLYDDMVPGARVGVGSAGNTQAGFTVREARERDNFYAGKNYQVLRRI